MEMGNTSTVYKKRTLLGVKKLNYDTYASLRNVSKLILSSP